MSTRGRRVRKWLRVMMLPAVAVTAMAGCASGPSAQPAATHATSPSSPEATPKQLSGPLAEAGPGWTLAEYSASTSAESLHSKAGVTTLYLVSPQGPKYVMHRWPASQPDWGLIDWSGDKSRALFMDPSTNTVGQLVLATGEFTSFKLPGGTQAIAYTRPKGTAVLASYQAGSTNKILRYDLTGRLERTLASGQGLAATSAVYSPDGTALAVTATRNLELVGNGGGAPRFLAVPGHPSCQPARWWNAGTILAVCDGPGQLASRLWLVPADGAAPTALTQRRGPNGPDLGDTNAWQLPDGLYMQAQGPCGVVFIAKQLSDGSAAVVNVPQTKGNDNQIITALGSRLLVRAQTSCEPSSSLLWFTPTTNAVQMLIHTPSGIAGVVGVAAYQQ